MFGETTDGFYVLDNAAPSSSSSLSNVSVNSTTSVEPSVPCSSSQSLFSDVFNISPFDGRLSSDVVTEANSMNKIVCSMNCSTLSKLWHQRLGHLPYPAMSNIPGIPHKLNSEQNEVCVICPKARQTKLSFPSSYITSKQKFDLIHIDTWGPYSTPTYNGHRYFLTIVDDFTRCTWTLLLSTKSNAFPILKAFFAMVERQFDVKIKKVRSDNAYELGSGTTHSQFFSSLGVLHQTSCVATPKQNGVVERKHKHLLEICRALLFQSNLPIKFWGDCLVTTTLLINRFPSRILGNVSPY